jgi:hypothetical protein
MVQTRRVSSSRKVPRWLRYVGYSLLSLVTLVGALYVYVFVWFVPPISVKVVDAISGKPVQGINLCLQVQSKSFHQDVLRKETSTTGTWGRSFFWPSVHQTGLLENWDGYSVRITDPQTGLAVPCGPDLGPGLNEVSGNSVDLTPVQNGRQSYFPVTLVHEESYQGSDSAWSATRRKIRFPLYQRIALIPILPDSEDCKQIPNRSQQQDCRNMNTEGEAISRHDLFPAIVAGVPRISAEGHIETIGFTGQSRPVWAALYGQAFSSRTQISMRFEEFANPQQTKDQIEWLRKPNDKSAISEEGVNPGEKVIWHRSPWGARAVWASGNRVVEISFLVRFAQEQDFVAFFLRKYPSTLDQLISAGF